MKAFIVSGTLIVLLLLASGCSEPPIREPVVTVTSITLSDISLRTLTVNTTVNIWNPNPVGARLEKVAFDITWFDETQKYLGHGERSGIDVNASGNTTVMIPVEIGTLEAAEAVASLVGNGALTLNVNGTATVDLKVTSFDKPFSRNRTFTSGEFSGLLPATVPGTGINLAEGMRQIGGLLGSVS
jgi:LEA14-like dessication related protein